jgi:hypothetical protein
MPCGRCAHEEFWLQDDSFNVVGRHFRVQNPERNTCTFLPNSSALLIDAREGDTQPVVVVQISATNTGHVLGDSQSLVLIPTKVVSDSHLIPATGSDVMPVVFGAKGRWRSYAA